MKFTAIAGLLALGNIAAATKYPIKGEKVNCRKGPSTSFDVVTTYEKGDEVDISCQTDGETITGNKIWGKTEDDCYVADYYVKTGSDGYVEDKCKDVPKPPDHGAGPIVNDYPYSQSQCGPADKWSYFICQCTSFVAWRINDRHNIKFTNWYKGCNYGNANEWDECAKQTGVKINNTPKPGSIAQTNKGGGGAGHVAWVAAVDGDKVTIEEYNYANYRNYGTRVVDKSAYQYIHIEELAK